MMKNYQGIGEVLKTIAEEINKKEIRDDFDYVLEYKLKERSECASKLASDFMETNVKNFSQVTQFIAKVIKEERGV